MSRVCTECNKHGTCAKEHKVASGKGWCSKFYQSRRALEADRDALRAELDRTKGEMEEIKYDLAKFQRSERVVSEMLVERTLDAENLRRLLAIALPHIEASAGAEHLFDGFRPRERPLDATVEEIRAALERKADA